MAEYIESKSILSKLKDAPDPYFGITYSMNIYRGCQHQCIYCDSRSKVYGIGDLSHIRIKMNSLNLLEKALSRKLKKATIGTGSMNDPYMPIEKKEQLTRKALEIIESRHFPVHVATKSDLVLRDKDILKEIGKIYSAVSITITTANDELSKKIEPGAPVSSIRFNALKQMADAGVYSGVLLTPVLPYITDNEENITEIVRKASDAGASYVLCWMGMTQREGQREYFHHKLNETFPGLGQKYISQFGNSYECPVPNSAHLYEKYSELMDIYNIPMSIKHFREQIPEQLSLFN
jgi:DNA repair photolyase